MTSYYCQTPQFAIPYDASRGDPGSFKTALEWRWARFSVSAETTGLKPQAGFCHCKSYFKCSMGDKISKL